MGTDAIDFDALDAVRNQFEIARRELSRLRKIRLNLKYDPDQPRVPAGDPDGGQWTSENGSSDSGLGGGWRSVMASKRSETFCEKQYERDLFHCKMVGIRACFSQAMERYAACLNGRQIPPLNY